MRAMTDASATPERGVTPEGGGDEAFGFSRKAPTPREVAFFHQGDDVDQTDGSHHHTLGRGRGQAARGVDLAKLEKTVEEAGLGDTGWIEFSTPLLNSFAITFGSPPAYRRLNGVVYFRNELSRGSAPASLTSAFILPAGFRPAVPYVHTAPTRSLASTFRLEIATDGTISVICATAAQRYPLSALAPYPAEL